MIVTSQQNDTVDLICWRHIGAGAEIVERTLELNPGLSFGGAVLPAGTQVVLPDDVKSGSETGINLWD